MTSIELGKKLTRKVAVTVQKRALVVVLHAGYMELRRAGARTSFPISYESVYTAAAKRAADRAREERQAERRARKGRAA